MSAVEGMPSYARVTLIRPWVPRISFCAPLTRAPMRRRDVSDRRELQQAKLQTLGFLAARTRIPCWAL